MTLLCGVPLLSHTGVLLPPDSPPRSHTHAASQTKSISMVRGDLCGFSPKSGRGKHTNISEGYENIAKCLRANGT